METCCLALRAGPSFLSMFDKKNLFWRDTTKNGSHFLKGQQVCIFWSKSLPVGPDNKSGFFFSPFLVSLPVGLPYGPDNRFKVFLRKTFLFILFHRFFLKKKKKGRKRQKKAGTGRDTSFALENLKPVVWPYGKGYQEGTEKKGLQKKRTFLKQKMETCCLARRARQQVRLFLF